MTDPRYSHPLYVHARRYWLSRAELGDLPPCHLCGRPIVGPFDLDHVRGAPGSLHPAHPACNRAEGGRHAHRERLARGVGHLTGHVSSHENR